LTTFGDTFAFEVAFRDALTRFSAEPVIVLAPGYSMTQMPLLCQPPVIENYIPAGRYGYLTTCAATREEHWRLSGVATAR
jgi:hypothetical protein